ncbi:MAG: hypothetical protein Q8K82_10385 [Gemmatimonadaceae bacterium]|nr:hypothetical protein [Gemmatimonadaceae bacterium]
MLASLALRPSLAVTSRRSLFKASGIVTTILHSNSDVSPDARSIVYVRSNPSLRVTVIQKLPAMVAKRCAGPAAPRWAPSTGWAPSPSGWSRHEN